jgi:hypothetical protein
LGRDNQGRARLGYDVHNPQLHVLGHLEELAIVPHIDIGKAIEIEEVLSEPGKANPGR